MTTLADVALTRPSAGADAGPLDESLYDLVEARFRRLVRSNPELGTYHGIHTEDHRLADGTRDAVLGEIADERAHLAAVEALDPAGLSTTARFERDLEIHGLRRELFDAEVARRWERRSTALDTLGDTLFLTFARDFAPLRDRLASVAARLDQVPTFLEQHKTRASGPQVRLWQQIEEEAATELPSFIAEMVAAGPSAGFDEAEQRRLADAGARASEAIEAYRGWLRETIADGTDDWALGRERYEELVALRAFDGLDVDAILEIGLEQLAETGRHGRRPRGRSTRASTRPP